MSGQYPVTATVTPIFPSAQPTRQTVKNIGLVTVYLGTSSSLSVSNGYALGPGSALSWEAGKPLFAVTASGSSTLSILDNGGSLFDASAVAAQISVAGVPSIDVPAILWDDVANTSSHVSQPIDVSKYQSVSVFIVEKQTSGPDPAAPGIGSSLIRSVFLDFSDSVMGTLPPPLREYAGAYDGGGSQGIGNTPQFVATLPVVGDRFTVTVNGDDAGIAALTSRIIVIGSYRSVQRATLQTWNVYQTHDGFLSGISTAGSLRWETPSFTANQQMTSLPPTIAGPGQIAVYVGTAFGAPGITVTVQEQSAGAVLAALLNYTGTGLTLFQVNFPGTPIELVVKNNTAGIVNSVVYVGFLYDLG